MAVQSASRHLRASMTIPGTATQVAPEVIYLNADKDAASVYFGSATSKQTVQKVQVLIENLIATATAVVQYLRPGGSWATPADVFVAQTLSAAGLGAVLISLSWQARVIGISGGTGGAMVVSVAWEP